MFAGNTAYEIEKLEQGVRKPLDVASSYSPDRYAPQISSMLERELDSIESPFPTIKSDLARTLGEVVANKYAEQPVLSRDESLAYFERTTFERELNKADGIVARAAENLAGEYGNSESMRRRLNRAIDDYDFRSEFADHSKTIRTWSYDKSIDPLPTIEPDEIKLTLNSALYEHKDNISEHLYSSLAEQIDQKKDALVETITNSAEMYAPKNRLEEIMQLTTQANSFEEARNIFDREIITDALEASGWNKSKAAEYLSVSPTTLRDRMKKLDIGNNVASLDERRDEQQAISPVQVNEEQRLQALVEEYQASRDTARVEKEAKVFQFPTKLRV